MSQPVVPVPRDVGSGRCLSERLWWRTTYVIPANGSVSITISSGPSGTIIGSPGTINGAAATYKIHLTPSGPMAMQDYGTIAGALVVYKDDAVIPQPQRVHDQCAALRVAGSYGPIAVGDDRQFRVDPMTTAWFDNDEWLQDSSVDMVTIACDVAPDLSNPETFARLAGDIMWFYGAVGNLQTLFEMIQR
jgi:hypothetical protein